MTDVASHKRTQSLNVQKVSRLLQYLLKLASLRAKLVRTIDAYEDVLWVSDVPHDRLCFTQAWGRDTDHDPDVWLEVQHSDEPAIPAVPALCEGWVNLPTIRNKDDLPALLDEITRQIPNPKWQEGSNEEPSEVSVHERLADHPNIQAAWGRIVPTV